MKRINKLFNPRLPVAILLSTVVLASCTKKFDEINTDRNAIATVGASELPFLFAKSRTNFNTKYLELPGCSKPVRRPVCTVFCLYSDLLPIR